MVIPCLTALYVEEESVWPFLICLGITGGCGALMTLLRPKSRDMGKREAILLTGFTWVVLSLFGMLRSCFYGTHLSITDAFFETMSGFTTTGASVLNTLVDVPKSILLWRCIIQWIGGLGIILFACRSADAELFRRHAALQCRGHQHYPRQTASAGELYCQGTLGCLCHLYRNIDSAAGIL